MLRRLTVFETADGARFDDEDKALEHIADLCREAIDRRLKAGVHGRFTGKEIYLIIMALVPDALGAAQLANELTLLTTTEVD